MAAIEGKDTSKMALENALNLQKQDSSWKIMSNPIYRLITKSKDNYIKNLMSEKEKEDI